MIALDEKMSAPTLKQKEICIIGAGNGGSAIAGDMTLAGHRCRLFEFPEYVENIKPIMAQGGIHVSGIARTGFAKVTMATMDLVEAVRGADLIMVTTQALAHERVARELAPHLSEGQAVILWPGSGGTLVFRKVVLEALSGTYADVVKPAFSILEPALYNVNIIVHPVGALLNMGRIEHSKGAFWMYKEGLTPSVKKVITRMDTERSSLFKRLGYTPYSYDQIFWDSFNMSVEEFAKTSSQGPFSMQDRYVTEDIPMGASLTVSIGRKVGVPMPTYETMIHLASVVNETDFYAHGRTLENLGLSGLSLEELKRYFLIGKRS
jgi:opine dehydrogenase